MCVFVCGATILRVFIALPAVRQFSLTCTLQRDLRLKDRFVCHIQQPRHPFSRLVLSLLTFFAPYTLAVTTIAGAVFFFLLRFVSFIALSF